MRPRYLAALLVTLAGVALLPATTQRAARADTTGTPTFVNAYTCIVNDGGQTTRPAGSTIIIQQGFAEQSLGTLRDFLLAQTSIVSVNDASMFDVSDEYGKPVQGGAAMRRSRACPQA